MTLKHVIRTETLLAREDILVMHVGQKMQERLSNILAISRLFVCDTPKVEQAVENL